MTILPHCLARGEIPPTRGRCPSHRRVQAQLILISMELRVSRLGLVARPSGSTEGCMEKLFRQALPQRRLSLKRELWRFSWKSSRKNSSTGNLQPKTGTHKKKVVVHESSWINSQTTTNFERAHLQEYIGCFYASFHLRCTLTSWWNLSHWKCSIMSYETMRISRKFQSRSDFFRVYIPPS